MLHSQPGLPLSDQDLEHGLCSLGHQGHSVSQLVYLQLGEVVGGRSMLRDIDIGEEMLSDLVRLCREAVNVTLQLG